MPGENPTLQLALLPRVSEDLAVEGSLPINRMRITAFLEESGDTIGVLIEDIDPEAESWTVSLMVEVPPTDNPSFYIVVELINVTDGVETVEWSGRSLTLPLTLGTIPEVREVAVGRGPLANLKVTSVVIADHVERMLEGFGIHLRATVTTTDPEDPPLLFWASLNPATAVVSAEGLVTGIGPGEAVIVATAGLVADTTFINVDRRPVGVTLDPDSVVLRNIGDSVTFTAAVVDPRGDPMEGEAVLWEVESPETLTDLGDGLFRAAGPGATVVIAKSVRAPNLAALAKVMVDQIPDRIEVDPASVRLGSIGARALLSASSWDANGHGIPNAAYAWISLEPSIASVDSTGMVTAVATGDARVVVSAGEVADTASITVEQILSTVAVGPPSRVFTSAGQTVQFSATALDAAGVPIPSITEFAWSSGDETIVTVDASGLVTAVDNGETAIVAETGGVRGSAGVKVERVVVSVTFTPSTVNFESLQDSLRLDVIVADEGGTAIPSSPTWTSLDESVVVVDEDGILVSIANGQTSVEAEVDGKKATAAVTVNQVAAAVELAPDTASLSWIGEGLTFQAQVMDARGQPITDAEFSWAVWDATILGLQPLPTDTARVLAKANGATRVEVAARRGGAMASTMAAVTVQQTVDSVEVTPGSKSFTSTGETQQFTAQAFDAGGTPIPSVTVFAWTEGSGGSVVTVDLGGLVTAVADGATNVTAEADGVRGSASVDVAQAVASIRVTPSTKTLTAKGQTETLTASAFDAGGALISTLTSFNWTEGSGGTVVSLAPVSGASTVVTANGDGDAVVAAESGGVQGTAQITVAQSVASVVISPARPATLTSIGKTLTLSASVRDVLGNSMSEPVTWASLEGGVAMVDGSGMVTAVSNGTARIVATSGSASDMVTVTVQQAVSYITVTPGARTFTSVGETQQFSAVAFDAGGTPVGSVGAFAWAEASAGLVISLDGGGLASALVEGHTTVTATANGVMGSAPVTVDLAIATIEVTPDPHTFASKGEAQTFTAVAKDGQGQVLGSVTSFTWHSGDRNTVSVGATSGPSTVGTAVADGTAAVFAEAGGVQESATVTVARVPAGVAITPAPPAPLTFIGETTQLSATVTDALGQPMAEPVTWTSLDEGVATVSGTGLVTGLVDGTTQIVATSGSASDTVAVTVQQVVAYVTVTPGSRTFTSSGETQQLTATAFDAGGSAVASAGAFNWAEGSGGAVVTVDGVGLVTAGAEGTTSVTATASGVTGSASVTVNLAIAAIEVSPDPHTFASKGETQSFTAVAKDGQGQVLGSVTSFTWSSGNRNVVTVGATSGASTVGTAVADGTTTVIAEAGGVQGSATVTVARVVAGVAITPNPPATLTFIGETTQLSATVTDALGQHMSEPVTWSSLDTGFATVSGAGLVTAVADGTARILATSGAVTDTVTVTVQQAVSYVAVTPGSKTFSSTGETQQFSAVAFDAGDTPVAAVPTFAWAEGSSGAVVTVDLSGLVTAVGDGTTTVSATADGVTGSASVTVGLIVASIEVSPDPHTFASKGEAQSFTAVAKDGQGQVIGSVTSFTWSTGNRNTVAIGATSGPSTGGTAVADGVTTVVAEAGGVQGSATVTVARVVAGVTVTPDPPAPLNSIGETTQLSATVTDALGQPMAEPVTWSSLEGGVVGVDAAGVVTALADGTARIVATSGTVSDTVTVTVLQVVAYVTVTPGSRTFTSSGETQQFSAVAYDAGDTPVASVSAFTWDEGSGGAVVTVDGTGLATAAANGATTVTATAGGVTGSASVTVGLVITSVQVNPDPHTFTSKGETQLFPATALDAQGAPIGSVTSFAWSTLDRNTVTIGVTNGPSTVGTAVADGVATVIAEAGGVQGSTSVTVARVVAAVTVAPDPPAPLTFIGETTQLSATVSDGLGQPMAEPVTWTSLDGGVAGVSGSGLVTAIADGTAQIVATSGAVSDTVTVTVQQAVSYVTLTPGSKTFSSSGETQQFSAVAYDSGDTPVASVSTFIWAEGSGGSVVTVDGTGLATAVANGTTSVTATASGVTGSASVTVDLVVASIEVSPDPHTFASKGETQSFTAVAKDAQGQVIGSVTSFTWTSGDRNTVTAGATSGASTVGTAVADGVTTLIAEAGGVQGSATVTVDRVVVGVAVTPDPPSTLTYVGETDQLSATVTDALGETMSEPVTWASLDAGVASVGLTGLVTAVADGTAQVVATSGSASDTVIVTVQQAVIYVSVTPGSRAFTSSGEAQQFSAVAYDAGDTPVASVSTFVWAEGSGGAVVTVDGTGLSTAVDEGTTTVTATAGGVTGSAAVTVDLAIATIEVSPDPYTFASKGETQSFTAVAKDGQGQVIGSVTSFTWSSGDRNTVSVGATSGPSTAGTAVADGTTTIIAEAGGVQGSASVTVARVVVGVAVTPDPPPTLTYIGETTQLNVSVTDALGQPMATAVTWASLDVGVAGVDGTGLVTVVAEGTAQVVATSGSVSDTVTVTVQQAVSYVAVTPGSRTFTAGDETQQFSAVAYDAGDTPVASVSSFSWAEGSSGVVVTVDGAGLVTAVADGNTTVTATTSGVSGSAAVTVDLAPSSVTISPDPPPTLTAINETTQLTAVVLDANGNPIIAAIPNWSSLAPTVALVDATTGLVTAKQNGTAQIVAESGGVADTVTVTVQQAIATIVISPDSLVLSVGTNDIQLTAEAQDSGGTPVDGATFSWLSNDTGVATVGPTTGSVSAVAVGSTSVDASSGGVTGSAPVRVTDADLTRTWSGDSSGDLLDPANWEPAGLPSATDSLVITASADFTPTLTGDFEIGTLTVEAGAELDIGTFNLTVNGDLEMDGVISGDGTVELTGTDVNLRGTLPNLDISGSVTTTGTTTITGEVTIDGSLDLGTAEVTVSGDVETTSGGILTMSDPSASLDVNGDLLLGGGDTDGTLTDGVIHLAGELVTVTVSFKTFNPSDNHTVILDGTTQQSVYLEFPGEKDNRFQNLIVDNPAGVVFQTDIPILGDATILQGTLSSAPIAPVTSTTVTAFGNIFDASGVNWQIDETVISGSAPSLPSALSTKLTFDAATALQADVNVTGDVLVTGRDANLQLNGHDLTVSGDFTVESTALLTMTNANDDLTVGGSASFAGASTVGTLSAGRFWVAGDFTWEGNNEDVFAPSGAHQVIFNGAGAQQIFGGNGAYAFQELRIVTGANVTMTEDLTVMGDMLIEAGSTFTVPAGLTLTIVGTLTDPGGGLVRE